MANLHSASQALFNIYIWMLQARHEEIFFDRVRIFSIVLNAHEITMKNGRTAVQGVCAECGASLMRMGRLVPGYPQTPV